MKKSTWSLWIMENNSFVRSKWPTTTAKNPTLAYIQNSQVYPFIHPSTILSPHNTCEMESISSVRYFRCRLLVVIAIFRRQTQNKQKQQQQKKKIIKMKETFTFTICSQSQLAGSDLWWLYNYNNNHNYQNHNSENDLLWLLSLSRD